MCREITPQKILYKFFFTLFQCVVVCTPFFIFYNNHWIAAVPKNVVHNEASYPSVAVAKRMYFFKLVMSTGREFNRIGALYLQERNKFIHQFFDVLPVGSNIRSYTNKISSEFSCNIWFCFAKNFLMPF